MSRAVSPAPPSLQANFADLFSSKPFSPPPTLVEEIPTIEILPNHTLPITPLAKRGPCKHEPVPVKSSSPQSAILLPRSRLGTVSYRPHGSNVEISANIINMRTQLQRRDTGQIYYSVTEFHACMDIEYGPGAAVGDFLPRVRKTHQRSVPDEFPPISPQKPPPKLKCGTQLDHSDEWL